MEVNWNLTQPDTSAGPFVAAGDWRAQLQPEARQRISSKIMETLKRHLPLSGPEGPNELRKIAIRFEEKIYGRATSQSDYLRTISLKMLSMESKTHHSAPINPAMSYSGAVNQYPTDPENDPVTGPRSNTLTNWPTIPEKRSTLSCGNSSISEHDSCTKKRKLSELVLEKGVAEGPASSCHVCTSVVDKRKEPTFSCPICLCALASPFSTICGHIFCEACIKDAIRRRNECPTCRKKLTMRNIHRVYLPTMD